MTYQLRMSAEIGDWLAELSLPGSPELVTATEVGAAIAAAMSAADVHDLALISNLAAKAADPVDGSDLRAAVDYMYERLQQALRGLHGEVADAGSFRTTTRRRYTPAGSEPLPFTPAEIAAAKRRERAAAKLAQRYQGAVEIFSTRREVAKARITAAEGARQVQRAFLASAVAAGAEPPEIEQARADLAAAESSLLVTKGQAVGVLAEARRILLAIRREAAATEEQAGESGPDEGASRPDNEADGTAGGAADGAGAVEDSADGTGVAAGLLELRADSLGADVRILCAVQPPGTLTLLAVLEGSDAIDAHRDRAITLASELLGEIQAEDSASSDPTAAAASGSAGAGELTFAATAPFLAKFFPHAAGQVMRRAASLAAASTLQALRRKRGLSLDDLDTRTGMHAQELWELETGGLRSARLSQVAAYVRAVGGTLTLATDDGTAIIG
jgi:hypothetical protein